MISRPCACASTSGPPLAKGAEALHFSAFMVQALLSSTTLRFIVHGGKFGQDGQPFVNHNIVDEINNLTI